MRARHIPPSDRLIVRVGVLRAKGLKAKQIAAELGETAETVKRAFRALKRRPELMPVAAPVPFSMGSMRGADPLKAVRVEQRLKASRGVL